MSSFRNYSLFPRLRIRSSVFWANSSFFVSERAIFFMIPYFLDLLQDLEPFHFRHRVIIIFPLTWDCNKHASLGPWTIPLTRDLEPFHFRHGVIIIFPLTWGCNSCASLELWTIPLPAQGYYNFPSYLGLQLMFFSGTLNHSTYPGPWTIPLPARVIIIFPLTWGCNSCPSPGPWTIPLPVRGQLPRETSQRPFRPRSRGACPSANETWAFPHLAAK